jgi:hypothetical protein
MCMSNASYLCLTCVRQAVLEHQRSTVVKHLNIYSEVKACEHTYTTVPVKQTAFSQNCGVQHTAGPRLSEV